MSTGPFAGDLFICRQQADGTYEAGWLKLEVNKLEPDASDSDTKQRISRSRSSYGQAIKTIIIPKPTKIKIDLNEDSHEAAAMVFRATKEVLQAAAGSVTDEVASVAKGLWTDLAHELLTEETVVVKNTAGTTTYTEGVDYEVDYEGGMILATDAGAIPSGQVKVSYDHAAIQGARIKAAQVNNIRARLRLQGHEVNNVSKRVRFEAPSAVLSPSGGSDLMAPDPTVQALAGTLEAIDGNPPFVVDYI